MEYELPMIDIKQGTKKLLTFHSLNMNTWSRSWFMIKQNLRS